MRTPFDKVVKDILVFGVQKVNLINDKHEMGFGEPDELVELNCKVVGLFAQRLNLTFGLEEKLLVNFWWLLELKAVNEVERGLFGVDMFGDLVDDLHDGDSFAEPGASRNV